MKGSFYRDRIYAKLDLYRLAAGIVVDAGSGAESAESSAGSQEIGAVVDADLVAAIALSLGDGGPTLAGAAEAASGALGAAADAPAAPT